MNRTDAFHHDTMLERQRLGAKLRATRAILNLSQTEFALRVELTQKSVHRLEQAQVDAKRSTLRVIERFWHTAGLAFEDLPDGSFTIAVACANLTDHPIALPVVVGRDRLSPIQ